MTKPKKNIIFIHPDLGIGGAERLIIDAAVGLQALGHHVTIFTNHCDRTHCFDEARDGTLTVHVRGATLIPPHILGRLSILCAILRQLHLLFQIHQTGELRALHPDVFFLDQLSACVPVLRYLWPSARVLFYCHFPDKLLAGDGRRGGVKWLYRLPFDRLEEWSTAAADGLLVNSRFTRGVVRGSFTGLKGRELGVVYPCVDVDVDSMVEGGEKGRNEVLWEGKKILLSINRFERKKGVELALRAYAALSERERRVARLVIAGGYDPRVSENVQYHQTLIHLADSLALRNATTKTIVTALNVPDDIDVLFLLSVSGSFKSTLLRAATLLLYTPPNEHFGIVPLEAMGHGVPILAADSGGPLETVVEGQTGWLRPVEDVAAWKERMAFVLNEMTDVDRECMAAMGRTRVAQEFSRKKMAQRLQEEVDRICVLPRRRYGGLRLELGLGLGWLGIVGTCVAALGVLTTWVVWRFGVMERGSGLALRQNSLCLGYVPVESAPIIKNSNDMAPPSRPYPEIIDLTNDTPVCKKTTATSTTSIHTRSATRTKTHDASPSKGNESFAILSDDEDFDFAEVDDFYYEERTPKRVRVDDDAQQEAAKKATKLSATWGASDDDVWNLSDDDVFIDESRTSSARLGGQPADQRPKKKDAHAHAQGSAVPALSERTSALLAELRVNRVAAEMKKKPKSKSGEKGSTATTRHGAVGSNKRIIDRSKMSKTTKMKKKQDENKAMLDEESSRAENEDEDEEAADEEHPTAPLRQRKAKLLTEPAKPSRDRGKQTRLESKAAEKARKEAIKESKAREKQAAADLAAANKSRTDKKISTPEMIVDLPLSLDEDSPVGGQIRSFLKNLGVEVTSYAASPSPSLLPQNLIRWRRKVTAVYNEQRGHWEPVAEHVRAEKHVLCLMPAREFVELATAEVEVDGQEDLDAHVRKLKSLFDEVYRPIYLIEGLAGWMRKNKNVRNRAYQAEVRNAGAGAGNDGGEDDQQRQQPTRTGRRKKPVAEYIDEDRIEDALLRLQIVHRCLIHHTATAVQSAEWVSVFTQHISTIPYRAERMNLPTAFCMDVGQVKTGVDASDTYVKMLQEIVRVTGPVAYGIAAEYPDVRSLVRGFERIGPSAIQDLKKTANKSGAFTNANIGPALSKRIFKIFTGTDPGSHDV
ncbi:MAG: Alpha-1,3-mannosyltransferase-like protein [Peltula sp. TS41687]|nr:MAG: Alpha-1,3-mannosyltransferase-like protein [Peltula sp. TS41687]